MINYIVLGSLVIAILGNLRIIWLNKHDLCEPHADRCIKQGAGHFDRHHGAKPVPFHARCPR